MTRIMDFLICTSVILCMLYFVESCEDNFCERQLYIHLFQTNNYTKQVRPARTPDEMVDIYVSLSVNNLVGIDELNEQMQIMGFFALDWYDPQLTWDPLEFGNVTDIVVPASDVWTPDLAMSNSMAKFYEYTHKRDFMVAVYFDGYVLWEYGGIISTSCNIDMAKYPFDAQNCSINLETWRYDTNQMKLYLYDPAVFIKDSVKTDSLWNFTGVQATSEYIYSERFQRLTFKFEWQRRQLYYFLNIVIPAMLMTIVALGVFWLPVDSGEKISLAVTILLAFSVFLIIIMDHTPVTSLQIPLLTQLVIVLMSVTTLALIIAILLAYLQGKANIRRAPKWLRVLCLKYLAKGMLMDVQLAVNDYTDGNISSGILGPLYYEMESGETPTANGEVNPARNNNDKEQEQSIIPPDTITEVKQISKYLRQLLNGIEGKVRSADIKDEWTSIGLVIDRFFFFVSVLLLVVLVPLIFYRII